MSADEVKLPILPQIDVCSDELGLGELDFYCDLKNGHNGKHKSTGIQTTSSLLIEYTVSWETIKDL